MQTNTGIGDEDGEDEISDFGARGGDGAGDLVPESINFSLFIPSKRLRNR
jgi:hypothetical protein